MTNYYFLIKKSLSLFMAYIFVLMLGLVLFSFESFAQSKSFLGRLPTFNLSGESARYWVHQNSIKAIYKPLQFDQVKQRLSPKLSTACTLGLFNQKKLQKYYIVAKQSSNRVIMLGYANGKGVNLFDPEGRSRPNMGYLFRYDKTGMCEVYLYS